MTVTLHQISEYLDRRGWIYRFEREYEQIITGIKGQNLEHLLIVIRVSEEGKFFQFFVPEVIAGLRDHPYQKQIFETLLSIGWETKLVRWAYDRTNGAIQAEIGFPMMDGTLTEVQFNYCLEGLISLVDAFVPRLKRVMESGEDPSMEILNEQFLLQFEQQVPGLLSWLEKALETRRKRLRF